MASLVMRYTMNTATLSGSTLTAATGSSATLAHQNSSNPTIDPTNIPFNSGGYMLFSGTTNTVGNYVQIPAFTIPTSGMSIAFWFFMNPTSGGWSRILDFGNGAASNNILISRNGAENNIALQVYNSTVPSFAQTFLTNGNNGSWYHVAITLSSPVTSNCTYTFYINGIQTAQYATQYYPTNTSRSLCYLGKSNWADAYFNGGISDFRIYSGALSSSEVTTLFNGYGLQLSTINATLHASYASYNILSADAEFFFVPGTMNAYLGASDPDGWVICDGQPRTYNSKYQSLVTMGIGSFSGTTTYTPPDYRGYFLRGDNKGISGNAKLSGYGSYSSQLKSYQSHSDPTHTHQHTMKNVNIQHNHNLSSLSYTDSTPHQHSLHAGGQGGSATPSRGQSNGNGGPEWTPTIGAASSHVHNFKCENASYNHKHTKNYIENNSNDYETRPASLSINWCIKY